MKVFKFGGASVMDAHGVRNVANIIKQNSQDSIFIVVSAMGKTTNAFPHERDKVEDELEDIFAELYWAIEETQIKSYDYEYDQIVSQGEFISTRIVAAYLNASHIETQWLDARDLIRTDNTYREGHVDWVFTQKSIDDLIGKKLNNQTPHFF